MKCTTGFIAAMLILILPGIALAALDGNGLLQKCGPIEKLYDDPASMSSKEASGVIYCLGYIDSFIETFDFQVQAQILKGVPYCLPEGELSKKDIVKAVVGFMESHPDELGKPAGYQILLGLRDIYPCSGNDAVDKNKKNSVPDKE